MIETGDKVLKETRFAPVGVACAGERSWPAGGRRALLCGIAGLALLVGVAAPVSLDGPGGEVGVKSAFAGGSGVGGGGGGGGGAGGGGGKGGGSYGKRHFPGGGDDGDDSGGDSGGSLGGVSVSGGGASVAGENRGGGGGAAADMASAASFDAIRAIEGAPAASLPTIQEIFALPDDAVLSSADEMRLISQGWGKPAD